MQFVPVCPQHKPFLVLETDQVVSGLEDRFTVKVVGLPQGVHWACALFEKTRADKIPNASSNDRVMCNQINRYELKNKVGYEAWKGSELLELKQEQNARTYNGGVGYYYYTQKCANS
jgi:hypothetical protein